MTRKTAAEKLAEFDAQQAKARRALETQCEIEGALPVRPWRVYVHPLYGVEASADWTHNFYSYRQKDVRQPTWDDVIELAEMFPPEPMVLVKNGCTSFRTRAHVDALPEKKKERWEQELDIAPFRLKLSAFQNQSVTVTWPTFLRDRMIQIRLTLALGWQDNGIGRFDIRWKNYMGGKRVDYCQFLADPNLTTVFRGDEPVAQLERPIKWGTGSDDVPNDFTLYFVHLRPDMTATAADLARTIQKNLAKKEG